MKLQGTYLVYGWTFRCMVYTFIIPFIVMFSSVGIERPFDYRIIVVFTIILMIIGAIISKRLGLKPIEISIIGNNLKITYYTFNKKKIKKNRVINLQDVKSFDDFDTQHKFKLTLKNWDEFKIYKHSLDIWSKKDDLEILIKDFKAIIDNPNILLNKNDDLITKSSNNIKIETINFFKSDVARIIFAFSILGLIAIVNNMFSSEEIGMKYLPLIIIIIGYAVLCIYNLRKK